MTIKKLKSTLPDKPSKLILVSLKDLAKCERSKKYDINMSFWHCITHDNICSVCLAGSVIAKTLKTDPQTELGPERLDITQMDKQRLFALDHFRSGDIKLGLQEMNMYRINIQGYTFIEEYGTNPTKFKADMRKMAKYLKSKGL